MRYCFYRFGVSRHILSVQTRCRIVDLNHWANNRFYGDLPSSTQSLTIARANDQIDVINMVKKLRGVYFHWNPNLERSKKLGPQREMGLIAQEVERVLPELVGGNSDGYKSVDYPKMVSFLIEVNKAQQNQIDNLGLKLLSENKILKSELAQKDARLAQLEKMESRLASLEASLSRVARR